MRMDTTDVPQPRLPDNRLIRTYPTDYATPDTESDNELPDGESNLITGKSSAWVLQDQDWMISQDAPAVLVKKPTASELSHRDLNPSIYKRIQNVGQLDDLAQLLKSDSDWEEKYNLVIKDSAIVFHFNNFCNAKDDYSEWCLRLQFMCLAMIIGMKLGIETCSTPNINIMIGGILANHQYDIRSCTDMIMCNMHGVNLLAAEVKTNRSFSPEDVWYHGCRGIEVVSSIYAHNCPTFLITPKQWKLFVENDDRNAILTCPFSRKLYRSAHMNSNVMHPMGTTFLKVIVICLLSKRGLLGERAPSKLTY